MAVLTSDILCQLDGHCDMLSAEQGQLPCLNVVLYSVIDMSHSTSIYLFIYFHSASTEWRKHRLYI